MRLKTSNYFLNLNHISINSNTFDFGNSYVGTIHMCHFYPDYGLDNTGGKLLPDGIDPGKIYYYKVIVNNSNKLFLTYQNAIDDVGEFVFTEVNLEGFYRCIFTTQIFTDHNYFIGCVERASVDVEDMFCCPSAVELITSIPEFLTLDTGSEDDSGDYYLATYKVMNSIPPFNPPAGQLILKDANLAYKSRNKIYEQITREQSNIYQGPNLYGTFVESYNLAWEIYTDAEIVDGEATGNIRLKVVCTIWSYGQDNGQQALGLKTLQEYYSDYVDKEIFDYAGTCTIVDNMDVDFMFPSVLGYYETPAGLPIPHSVLVSRSVLDFTMPEAIQLYMPNAVFRTPEGDIELENIDEVLNYNEVLGGYFSNVKTHYLIQGRYFLPFIFFPTVLSQNPTAPNLMGIAYGNGEIDSGISEIGGGLDYSTATSPDDYGYVPPLYFTNDIEERGPFVGSLSGDGAGFGGILSGIDHGKAFIDSRAKAIINESCTATGAIVNNDIVVTINSSGSGYLFEPTVIFESIPQLIGVATLGENENEGKVVSITISNPTNDPIIFLSGINLSPPPPSYFDLSEKNNVMNLFFSSYESYFKPLIGGNLYDGFYNDTTQHFYKNNAYYITSNNPDAFISSLEELDTPTIDEQL